MADNNRLRLLLLEQEKRKRQGAAQPDRPAPIREGVEQLLGQAATQTPVVGAAKGLAQLSPTAQKAVLTGGGATVGQVVGGPLGAAAGAALGGTAAEAVQQPETTLEAAKLGAETTLAASPLGSPQQTVEKSMQIFEGLKEVNPREAGKFAKERAIEGATAAVFGLIPSGAALTEATGPFTAVLKNPKLVFTASRKKAFDALNKTKEFLIKGESARELGRLQAAVIPGASSRQVVDLANEAVTIAQKELPASGAQLLAYRAILQKARDFGGPLAGRFAKALPTVKKRLEALTPGIEKQFREVSQVMTSLAKQPTSSFVPVGGVTTRTAQAIGAFPGVRRVAGAAARGVAETLPGAGAAGAGAVLDALNQIRR